MAHRYSMLPSSVLKHADTLDLYIMDIGMRYDQILEQKRAGKYVKPVKKLSQDEMKDMIAKAKKNE